MSSSRVKQSLAATIPADILFMIVNLVFPNPKIEYSAGYRGDFLYLVRVCSHWRRVILSNPAFWTRFEVPQHNRYLLNEVLNRSADRPLEVFVDIKRSREAMICQFELLIPHLHRIRFFFWQEGARHDYDLNGIISLLFNDKPFPILKIFDFDMYTKWTGNSGLPWISRGTIPENFLVDLAPDLEELKISSMSISPQMPIFKTVTRLYLRFVWGITTIFQLFDLLDNTSHLEVLHIDHPMEIATVFNNQDLDGRAFEFPSLKSLLLNLHGKILLAIVGRIKVPFELDWKIDCQKALTYDFNVTPLVSFLTNVRKGTYVVFNATDKGLQMEFAQSSSPNSYNSSLKMELTKGEACLRRLHSVFETLDLSNVYFCDILCPPWSDLPSWWREYQERYAGLFFLLARLEKLVVACDHTEVLWLIMVELQPLDGELPCPMLTDLKVGIVSTTGQTLTKILASRKQAGNVLSNLTVEYDHRDPGVRDVVPSFLELVKNVELFFVNLSRWEDITFLSPRGSTLRTETLGRVSYTGRYPDSTVHPMPLTKYQG